MSSVNLIPDGTYNARITGVTVTPLDEGGDHISMPLAVDVNGSTEEVEKVYNVNSPKSKDFIKKDLQKIDVTVTDRDSFLQIEPTLKGKAVVVRTKTQPTGHQDLYFEGLPKPPQPKTKFVW